MALTLRPQGWTLVLTLYNDEAVAWMRGSWQGQPMGLGNIAPELAREFGRWLSEVPVRFPALLPEPLVGPFTAVFALYAGTTLVYSEPTEMLDTLGLLGQEAFEAAVEVKGYIIDNAVLLAQQYPQAMVVAEPLYA